MNDDEALAAVARTESRYCTSSVRNYRWSCDRLLDNTGASSWTTLPANLPGFLVRLSS